MKISVLIITYNHEKYIGQAIESVLMQRTAFDYELVIGEDCSTDRTREIVSDYHRRFPEKIRLILSDVNTRGRKILVRTFDACQGEYIALLEGDDYWTSPSKLQKQVDFLGRHPECAICFHPVWKVYEEGGREPEVFPQQTKPTYRLSDLIEANFIPTCSTVFRRGLFEEFPDWIDQMPILDWPLHVLNAQHGDIGCIDEVMGAYRIHDRGMTAVKSPPQNIQVYIEFYRLIDAHLNFKYTRLINRALSRKWDIIAENIAEIGLRQESVEAARRTVAQIFDQWPEDLSITNAWKSKVWGRLFVNFAFAARTDGDLTLARDYLLQAVRCDPHLLLNPGVWSAGIESFLGQRTTGRLRYLYRKAKRSLIDPRAKDAIGKRSIEARS